MTDAVLTFARGGTGDTGVTVTLPIVASSANPKFAAFTSYTVPAIAAGDAWSLKVTTASTAGALSHAWLVYMTPAILGVNDSTTTL